MVFDSAGHQTGLPPEQDDASMAGRRLPEAENRGRHPGVHAQAWRGEALKRCGIKEVFTHAIMRHICCHRLQWRF